MQIELGDRMKRYEKITASYLLPKSYHIIRLDGRSFHGLTSRMEKPFDEKFITCMNATMKRLCENISGCILGYCQSDEISLLITDMQNQDTELFFSGNIQKIVSISASIATAHFNQSLQLNFGKEPFRAAQFDSRVFTLPNRDEIINYFIWRQNDCSTNAIQMVAQSLYSHKELQNKKWNDLNELLFQKCVNFDHYDSHFKRGRVAIRTSEAKEFIHPKTQQRSIIHRQTWDILNNTPWFTKEKWFLENLIQKNGRI